MRTMIALILTGLCLAACNGTPEHRDYDDYQKPSPLLEKEIHDRIAALEYTAGQRLLGNQRRLIYIGEPAIPFLLTALKHPSPLTRSSCAYVLGGIRDLRTLPALRQTATEDEIGTVRYEAASALVSIGDKKHGFPVLVDGLEDRDLRNRYKCFEVLRQSTALTFDYEHDGEPDRRAQAVEIWRNWVEKTFPK